MDKDGTYSEKETASRADAALRRALNTPPQPKHGKVKESKGERGEQGLSGKTHGAPLKPGDMVGGFLVVSTDPALLAAMEYVSQAHLRSHRTDTEEVRLRAQRQLISDYVGQAVTSPAGVLAFPEWAATLQRSAASPHISSAQLQPRSRRGRKNEKERSA